MRRKVSSTRAKVYISEQLIAHGFDVAQGNLSHLGRTRNSELFLFRSRRLPHDLVLKYPRADSVSRAEVLAREEYDALRQLYGDNGGPPLCPKPYDLLLESGVLALEYVAAPSLRERLLDRKLDADEKLGLVKETGGRIRAFHERFATGVQVVRQETLLAELDAVLGDSRVVKGAQRYVELLREMAFLVSDREFPLGMHHGDCKPENFLCSDKGILMIDIRMRLATYNVRAIASFLNSLLLTALEPRGIHLLSLRVRAEDAFLAGYGWEKDSEAMARMAWFRLYWLLISWGNMARRNPIIRFYRDTVHGYACSLVRRQLSNVA
jgi:hypothetical protein